MKIKILSVVLISLFVISFKGFAQGDEIETKTNESMTQIFTNAKLGVGTSNPQARLHLYDADNDNPLLRFENNLGIYEVGISSDGLSFTDGTSSSLFSISKEGILKAPYYGSSRSRLLYTDNNGTVQAVDAGTEGQYLTVNNGGNFKWQDFPEDKNIWKRNSAKGQTTLFNSGDFVGIGAAEPEEKLHIYRTVGDNEPELFAGMRFESYGKNLGGAQAWDIKTSDEAVNFKYGADKKISEVFTKMTLNSSGHLGLGTSTPLTAFHVLKTSEVYNDNQSQTFLPSVRLDMLNDDKSHAIWDMEHENDKIYGHQLTFKYANVVGYGGEIPLNEAVLETQKRIASFFVNQKEKSPGLAFFGEEYENRFNIEYMKDGLYMGKLDGEKVLVSNEGDLMVFKRNLYVNGTDNGIGWNENLFNERGGTMVYGEDGGVLATYQKEEFQPVLVWDQNRRVGIGTRTPGAKLHVLGGSIFVENKEAIAALNSTGLVFDRANSSFIRNTNPDGSLAFSVGGVDNVDMLIDKSGKVGIGTGTAEPAAELEVAGTIQAEHFQGGTFSGTFEGEGASQWKDINGGINYPEGSVGIGTGSPGENKLVVVNTADDGYENAVVIQSEFEGDETQQVHWPLVINPDEQNRGSGFYNSWNDMRLHLRNNNSLLNVMLDSDGESYFTGDKAALGIGTRDPSGILHVYSDDRSEAEGGITIEEAGEGKNAKIHYLLTGKSGWTTGIDNQSENFIIGRGFNWSGGKDLVIDRTGKIGINLGSNTPEAELHVGGTVIAENFVGDFEGASQWDDVADGNINFPDGNVGIGTDAPDAKLHVYGTGSASGNVLASMMLGKNNGAEIQAIQESDDDDVEALAFRVRSSPNNTDNSFEALRIASNGNVGIGTSAPKNVFEIGGAYSFHSGGSKVIGLGYSPGGQYNSLINGHSGEIRLDPRNGRLFLGVSEQSYTAGQEGVSVKRAISIESNGDVGIGVDDPQYDLHVAGTVKADFFDGDFAGASQWDDVADGNINFPEGNVGIGTDMPEAELEIKRKVEDMSVGDGPEIVLHAEEETNSNYYSKFKIKNTGMGLQISQKHTGYNNYSACASFFSWGASITSSLSVYYADSPGDKILLADDVNFKYGNNFKINPNGDTHIAAILTANEVLISLDEWKDVVFTNDYTLMPLNELEQFIKTNRHLPEIPSEKEIVENGMATGEIVSLQMQKIEELTLYTIEQQELIENQQKRLDENDAQFELLLKEINELKKQIKSNDNE